MAITVNPGQSVGQPDWEELAAQHGNVKSTTRVAVTEAQIKAAGLAGDDDPAFQQRPLYRYYFEDGTYVDARTASNGADYEVVDYKPSAKFAQTQRPTADPASPANRNEAELQRQREKNAALQGPNPNGATEEERRGQDPAYETDEERRTRADARIKQQGADAKAGEAATAAAAKTDDMTEAEVVYIGKGKERVKVTTYKSGRKLREAAPTNATAIEVTYGENGAKITKYDDGTTTTEQLDPVAAAREQRAAAEAAKGDTKSQDVEINGTHYTKVTTVSADGKTTSVRYLGPDGQPIDKLPSEGAATAGGPKMPEIVVGASQNALRSYWQALQDDPNMTPQARAARFQEAVQVATISVNEAATAQRERESTRNFDYNVASTKLNYLQTGMGQALNFVAKFNEQLPVGSGAGGRAFKALLGLQMIHMDMSGINDLETPRSRAAGGGADRRPPVPTLTPADLADPAKLDAKTKEIMAHPVFRPEPEATPPSSAPAPDAATVEAQADAVLNNQVAPAPDALPGAQSQNPPGSESPYLAPTGTPATPTVVPGSAGAQPFIPGSPPPGSVAAPDAAATGDIDPALLNQDLTNQPLPGAPQSMTQPTPAPAPQEDYAVLNQMRMQPPQQAAPPAPMPQQQDFAILNQPMPQPEQPAQPDLSDNPALLHTQAATTLPWQLTEEQYKRMKAAGIPDALIWSIPGQRIA